MFSPLTYTVVALTHDDGIISDITIDSALEMMESESGRHIGLLCFAMAVGKSVTESLSGHVLFEAWYAGLLGTPVAVCHAGGVLGGILAYSVEGLTRERECQIGISLPPLR